MSYEVEIPKAKANLIGWWNHTHLAAAVWSPAAKPLANVRQPVKPADMTQRYADPIFRLDDFEYTLANTFHGGDALPFFDTYMGPGGLGTFLGAKPNFTEATVWYDPCITDPDSVRRVGLDESNRWFTAQMALVDEAVRRAKGRYLVGMPDLIENLDTLAALRGTEEVLMDLVERPQWVSDRLAEINQAYFRAFDAIYEKIRDEDDGNIYCCYRVWGPGKTSKVQCDISCMLSPAMYNQFVLPHLREQCDWLDYSIYHLDGTTAMQHLDALLSIESLDAIEWTPQAGKPTGGSKEWYDLYRRIKAAGKSVQAWRVSPEDVVPLLDAVGPEGMFLVVMPPDQKTAEKVLADIEPYRK